MISFLLEEGVLTVGTLSGLFTAAMLNSFRVNILEPSVENIFPSHSLDNQFGNIIDPANQIIKSSSSGAVPNKTIKWQTFVRDFITWVFVMLCLYIFWKTVLHKYKKT